MLSAIQIHAILMAIGWLILVPAGTYMSTVGKSRFPNRWFSWHALFMSAAAVTILTGAFIAFMDTFPHFNGTHQIFGPILNGLLVGQVLVGAFIHFIQDESRTALNHLHRNFGMIVYTGGFVNVYLGLKMFIKHTDPQTRDFILFGTGAISLLELYLFVVILKAWWGNWKESREDYEPVINDMPVGPV